MIGLPLNSTIQSVSNTETSISIYFIYKDVDFMLEISHGTYTLSCSDVDTDENLVIIEVFKFFDTNGFRNSMFGKAINKVAFNALRRWSFTW